MATMVKLLYAATWKNNEIPRVKDWIIKLTKFVEKAKLTNLVRDKMTDFLKNWKPYMNFLLTEEKTEQVVYGFID